MAQYCQWNECENTSVIVDECFSSSLFKKTRAGMLAFLVFGIIICCFLSFDPSGKWMNDEFFTGKMCIFIFSYIISLSRITQSWNIVRSFVFFLVVVAAIDDSECMVLFFYSTSNIRSLFNIYFWQIIFASLFDGTHFLSRHSCLLSYALYRICRNECVLCAVCVWSDI